MNIKDTFLSLTDRTYPHGTEHELFEKLPQNLDMDEFGNLFIKIGDSDVMFTSHLDTATSTLTTVNHVIEDNMIKTDGTSILGADDKAGVTIMMYMIENNVPGLYYFFLGEEVGCVGSRKVAEKHKIEKLSYINKVISFDRRDLDSVITYQASSRCASDNFGKALADQLNLADVTFKYKNDPTGIYTDSAQFTKIYPECTNISVGYYSEHTYSERQNINHLEKLAEACLKVDWSSLPVERDPSKVEYSDWYDDYGYGYYGRGAGYANSRSNSTPNYNMNSYIAPKVSLDKEWFYDIEYNCTSCFTINRSTGDYSEVNICKERIDEESVLIYDLLNGIGMVYDTMQWNGTTLVLRFSDGKTTECTRRDIVEYIDDMDLVKVKERQIIMTDKSLRSVKTIDNPIAQTSFNGHTDLNKVYGYDDREVYSQDSIWE